MRRTLIIGFGEVGSAHANVLSSLPSYEVKGLDIEPSKVPEKFRFEKEYSPDIMLIATKYHPDFIKMVEEYRSKFRPQFINVLSTVPPGTCENIGKEVTHSTTRGIHPHLEEGLITIVKHIGGPTASQISKFYGKAGIPCYTHALARTTEAAHILNNCAYGVSLMFADEAQKLCREWGVDYFEAVMIYTQSNNAGYEALDQKSKCRMILTPPGGSIGGHCVTQSAQLIQDGKRPHLFERLSKYNEEVG